MPVPCRELRVRFAYVRFRTQDGLGVKKLWQVGASRPRNLERNFDEAQDSPVFLMPAHDCMLSTVLTTSTRGVVIGIENRTQNVNKEP